MSEIYNKSPKTPPGAHGLPTPVASGGGRSKDQDLVENNKQGLQDDIKQEKQEQSAGTSTGTSTENPNSWEVKEIARLKTLVAHYELQNKLLTIESYENAQRFEVESSIMQREVERLLMEKNAKRAGPALEDDGPAFADEETAAQTYRRRLRKGKLKLRDAAQLIREKDQEIERLKRRLREGRLHREAMEARNRDSNNGRPTGLSALGMLANQALQGQSNKQEEPEEREGNDHHDDADSKGPVDVRRPSVGSTVTEEEEEEEEEEKEEEEEEEKEEEEEEEEEEKEKEDEDEGDDEEEQEEQEEQEELQEEDRQATVGVQQDSGQSSKPKTLTGSKPEVNSDLTSG